MWALWSPPMERSLLTGLTYAGCQVGNVVTMPIAGYLCKHGFAGGWPSIFYTFGISSGAAKRPSIQELSVCYGLVSGC